MKYKHIVTMSCSFSVKTVRRKEREGAPPVKTHYRYVKKKMENVREWAGYEKRRRKDRRVGGTLIITRKSFN